MGDKLTAPDVHQYVGQDVVIEYQVHVEKIIQLRFATVLKGTDTNGRAFSISLDELSGWKIRLVRPVRWWRRLFDHW